MSITYPTFSDKEIVTPEKLNTFVQAIEAQFTAGLGTAEIQWPLIAGGNLIMGDYEITGAKKILKIVNAAQYATLTAALIAGSGGVVFIPPNTTIQADGVSLVGTRCAIVGAGPTSVLKTSDTPTAGYFMRNNSTGDGTEFLIANLKFDGNSEAGGEGLHLRHAESVVIHNCWFTDWALAAIRITSTGGSANCCENVRITDCEFVDGGDHHIQADSVDGLVIKGCESTGCDTSPFELVQGDSSAYMRAVRVISNNFRNFDEIGIDLRSAGAAADSKAQDWVIADNTLDGTGQASGPGIRCGSAAGVASHFTVHGNIVANAAADGIGAAGEDGIVANNIVPDAAGDGIDLGASNKVKVCGNMLADAGAYGIATASVSHSQIHDNDVSGASTGGVQLASTNSDVSIYNNDGQTGTPPPSGYFTTSRTITIPANHLRIGDTIRARTSGSFSAGGGDLEIQFKGTAVGASYSGTSTGVRLVDVIGQVTGATTVEWSGFGLVDEREVNVTQTSVGAVDLTADIEIEVDNAGLTTATYRGLWVTIESAEVQ